MNAFVTGGTGFVGSHLVEALLNDSGYREVRCLVRSSRKWLTGLDITEVKGDLSDLSVISKALDGIDTIFHVAGVVRAPEKRAFTLANVDATENLIRLAQKKGIKNLFILSSLAGVGPSNGIPIDERAPMRPVSMYGESKKEMEAMIHRVALPDDSIKIIRPPAVYGPREADIYTYFKTYNSGLCPVVGDGNNPKVSMVYVTDLIQGIMAASEKKESGVFTYFAGGEKDAYSWNQIAAITGKVLGKKALKIRLKPTLVKKVSAFIENAASLFGKYPVVNKEKANEMVLEWVCTSEKAKQELGYTPVVSLEEGISRTIRWYKKNNWL